MNLQKLKKNQRKTIVSIRLPSEIREWAQSMAHTQSTDDVRITESDVYREIIVSYFSQQRIQIVDEPIKEN